MNLRLWVLHSSRTIRPHYPCDGSSIGALESIQGQTVIPEVSRDECHEQSSVFSESPATLLQEATLVYAFAGVR